MIYKNVTEDTIIAIHSAIVDLNNIIPGYSFSMPKSIDFDFGEVKYSVYIDKKNP